LYISLISFLRNGNKHSVLQTEMHLSGLHLRNYSATLSQTSTAFRDINSCYMFFSRKSSNKPKVEHSDLSPVILYAPVVESNDTRCAVGCTADACAGQKQSRRFDRRTGRFWAPSMNTIIRVAACIAAQSSRLSLKRSRLTLSRLSYDTLSR